MMTCLEFRRRVGAEPFAADPEIEGHRSECAACARHQDDLRAMDDVIRRALAVDPPARAANPAAAVPGAMRRRLFAIAASLVAGAAVGVVLLVSAPRASIAREVIGHVAHEPGAMNRDGAARNRLRSPKSSIPTVRGSVAAPAKSLSPRAVCSTATSSRTSSCGRRTARSPC